MSQIGAWDIANVYFITEGTFGATPTTGAWQWLGRVKRISIDPRPTKRPVSSFARQNPSDWDEVKMLGEYEIVIELLKLHGTWEPYKWIQYIIEAAAGADGAPDNTLESFSLAVKLDLTTDEFWWLKGCVHDRVAFRGSRLDDRVELTVHGLCQWYDYGTTDPVSGSATRGDAPTETAVNFKDVDILYDPTSPATIMEDVNSFTLTLERTLDPRGTNQTNTKLYRDFVPTARKWSAEVSKDFDSKTELEHFIDHTKTKMTFEIPNAASGKIYALTNGYLMQGSGLPMTELELLNLRMQLEFAELAVSAHG